jgi:hypothetical protein
LDPVDRAWRAASAHRTLRHPPSAQHQRGVLLALAGFGATAFGIAPLAPDAADLPSRIVTESVTPEASSAAGGAGRHELELYRSDLTAPATPPTACCAG